MRTVVSASDQLLQLPVGSTSPASHAMPDTHAHTMRRRANALATARLVAMVCAAWILLAFTSHGNERSPTVRAAADLPPASAPWAMSPEAMRDSLLRPAEARESSLSAHLSGRHFARLASLRASQPPDVVQLYPRNLYRSYDGHWQVAPHAAPPFYEVPVPVAPPAETLPAKLTAGAQPVHSAIPPVSHLAVPSNRTHIEKKFGFTLRKGFALLAIQNYVSTTTDEFNAITGDLLLRNGLYRSSLDPSLRVVGVYDWRNGRILLVGDSLTENVKDVLGNLYTAMKGHQMANNITLDKLIAGFGPAIELSRKKDPVQRAPRKHSVAVLCPFEMNLTIQKDSYNDKPPRAYNLDKRNNQDASQMAPDALPSHKAAHYGATSEVLQRSARGTTTVHTTRMSLSTQSRIRQDQIMAQEEMVRMSGDFISKKCNTRMQIELATMDAERLFVKAINYTLLVTVVAFTQVIVLIRQMEMTSTQAGASRVSLMTVGLQAVADSYLCLGHLTLGIAVQTLFNAFATAAFFKFICFSIFLMRWMLLIWKARRPTGFSEGWEAMRRELSMLYSRFYASLLLGLFMLYQLHDHIRVFIFALYSFWVPQIVLNVVEDHRRPLLPMYIIGTSLTRLAIPLYFWGCPKNFMHIHPLPSTAVALVGWMGLQALILLSQYKFGPRWFIPKALLPEKYNYYRPILVEDDSDDDIEAQHNKGENTALVYTESRRECCICMEVVLINARDRMVTPCNHFFHAQCLERWLEVRLECALCRRSVPPP